MRSQGRIQHLCGVTWGHTHLLHNIYPPSLHLHICSYFIPRCNDGINLDQIDIGTYMSQIVCPKTQKPHICTIQTLCNSKSGHIEVFKGKVPQYYMRGPRNRLQLRNTDYLMSLSFFWSLWPLRSIKWCHGSVQSTLKLKPSETGGPFLIDP